MIDPLLGLLFSIPEMCGKIFGKADIRAYQDPSSPTPEAAVEWQGKVLVSLASQDVFMIF